MKEIEVKILEINPEEMESLFLKVGAKKEFDQPFKASFFDNEAGDISASGGLLRLRQEGPDSVLTHKKKLSSDGIKVMEETESQVADPDSMRKILETLGYQVIKETAKRRIQYAWKQSHLVIDLYEGDLAGIPPFIEIESPDELELEEVVTGLGFTMADTRPWNTYDLIRHYRIGL